MECKCISGKPEKKIELSEKRGDAASVVLNQTMLWIVGGFTSINPKATELVRLSTVSGTRARGPDLPLAINRFCMIEYLPSAIYIIGGIQERSISDKVWIVNPNANFTMRYALYDICLHFCQLFVYFLVKDPHYK